MGIIINNEYTNNNNKKGTNEYIILTVAQAATEGRKREERRWGEGMVPGQAYDRSFGKDTKDWSYVTALVSYTPDKIFEYHFLAG